MKPGYVWWVGGADAIGQVLISSEDKRCHLDEVVIDGWFHLEQLTTRRYQLELGRYRLDIHIAKNGRVTVTAGGHELSSYGVAKDE